MTTVKELRNKAKSEGVEIYYEMTKPNLLIALSNKEKIPEIIKEMRKKASCEHGRIRKYCKDCGGKKFCRHLKRKVFCKERGAKHFCEHGRLRYFCKQ